MSAIAIRLRVEGVDRIADKLRDLGPAIYRKHAGRGVRKAGHMMLMSSRRYAPKRKGKWREGGGGLLRHSLGQKDKYYDASESVIAVVGARKNIEGTFKGRVHKPYKIAHLVEFGHRIQPRSPAGTHIVRDRNAKVFKAIRKSAARRRVKVVAGLNAVLEKRAIGFVQPHPFLLPAYQDNREAAMQVVFTEIAKGLDAEGTKI